MTNTKNIEGIIFKIQNSGAADKVTHIIDQTGERQIALAKGVKKEKSRKSYSIDLANQVKCKAVTGYGVLIMSEIELKTDFSYWKNNYDKIIFIQFLCEVIDKFCLEDQHDRELYHLFNTILSLKAERLKHLGTIFLAKILELSGNLPSLNECVVTHEGLNEGEIFVTKDVTGFTKNMSTKSKSISDRLYKTEKYIVGAELKDALRINLENNEESILLRLNLEWLENALGYRLKSKEMLLQSLG